MQISMLQSKIHRVTTTHSELHYEGACAIDQDLLDAAGIREYQAIEIFNVNNGARFSTYAICAERGSGIISVNDAAARRAVHGDILIIAVYAAYDQEELMSYAPKLIDVDARNRIVRGATAIPAQDYDLPGFYWDPEKSAEST